MLILACQTHALATSTAVISVGVHIDAADAAGWAAASESVRARLALSVHAIVAITLRSD